VTNDEPKPPHAEPEKQPQAEPEEPNLSEEQSREVASLSAESVSERAAGLLADIAPKIRKGRRWLLHLSVSGGTLFLLIAACVVALYLWISTPEFENLIRGKLIAVLEQSTGGVVEIARFRWNVLRLSLDAEGITIHGMEPKGEEPYAHVDKIHAELGIYGLVSSGVSSRVVLHALEVDHPSFHLIINPDGSTNQPHPKHAPKPGKPIIDTLFDLRVASFAVHHGRIHIADKVILLPLDLQVHDAEAGLAWIPSMGDSSGETAEDDGVYRLNVTLNQLTYGQGDTLGKVEPMAGHLDLTALLMRKSLRLEQMRFVALNQTVTVHGGIEDFATGRWDAQADGNVDLRVAPGGLGLAALKNGMVTLHATVNGVGGKFQAEGTLKGTEVHYFDPIVDVHVSDLSASFRADGDQLLVSNIRTHPIGGGEIDGEFFYDNWLANSPVPGSAYAQQVRREHIVLPVPTGRVRAKLIGVTLDNILDITANQQYHRLGLDTVTNGPAWADWTGWAFDLSIGGHLGLAPSSKPEPGEVPVQGLLDGTYHAERGVIQMQTIDVHMPHNTVEGSGALAVFPIDRGSDLDVDLVSTDMTEFDRSLRALGLHSGTRVGAAALPGTATPVGPGGKQLSGQINFHGRLTSSWIRPRVEGHLSGTNVGIEIPQIGADAPPKFVTCDTVEGDGVYTPASIVLRHGTIHRGGATVELEGQVDSREPNYSLLETNDEFDNGSSIRARGDFRQYPIEDLLPLAGVKASVTGKVNGHIDLQGPVTALVGSGTADLSKADIYGTPVDHLRLAGVLQNNLVKLSSVTAEQGTGRLTGSGSWDMDKQRFQVDARGTTIDLGTQLKANHVASEVAGKLSFTVSGDGTVADPHVQAHAVLSGLTLGTEPVADLLISATTRQHNVVYDLSSHQSAGEFSAHGQTAMNAELDTTASLRFSKFDIGALLKLLKVTGINGQSNLEGTLALSGPLAHPEKLTGEANVGELAVVVQGVHLRSQGAAHAAIANGIARLDPLEVTGEDTDIKLRGSLGLTGKQQLDLAANGTINLRLAESIDPDLISSGVTSFQMEAHGPLLDPVLQGKVEFRNGSLALGDFPNGLSQINGTLQFIQNRLEVRSLTAMSGGGQLSLAGYLGFQHGLYADLTATGLGIRLRYPQGISSLADAHLHLLGPQQNLELSGDVQVTRFSVNSDLDLATFAAQSNAVQPIISPDAPSNHIRLNVHLTSAPQLNFQNAFAKLAGDVDLHLRGTLAAPSLLGRISLTEGSASVAGTRYELERGDINFNNPVRIQPILDLDATARVEDYDITLGLHGTPDKLNITYRSEPPLPEADVIALLALGRTSDEQRINSQTQQQAGDNPTTDALLGGALNATVSNRVQRLFGSGAVKVDPNFIGSIGNSSARVTVVEQIGQNVTFTFASNVNSTAQQLIQAEIAINRHVSLLVTQDESGIFSMVLKTRRRYR
jgi:translocation and assembly module TamB